MNTQHDHPTTPEQLISLADALEYETQVDEDGTLIGVSREAVHYARLALRDFAALKQNEKAMFFQPGAQNDEKNSVSSLKQQAEGDGNVERIRARLLERSTRGLVKYGVTTERKDLSLADWLRHLQEELLDAAVYAEAALATPTPALPPMAEGWIERAASIAESLVAGPLAKYEAHQSQVGTTMEHLRYMADKISAKEVGSATKTCRWLGYIQGALVIAGRSTLQAEKDRNAITTPANPPPAARVDPFRAQAITEIFDETGSVLLSDEERIQQRAMQLAAAPSPAARTSEGPGVDLRQATDDVLTSLDPDAPDGREFNETLFDMCRNDDYIGIYREVQRMIEERVRELAKQP